MMGCMAVQEKYDKTIKYDLDHGLTLFQLIKKDIEFQFLIQAIIEISINNNCLPFRKTILNYHRFICSCIKVISFLS